MVAGFIGYLSSRSHACLSETHRQRDRAKLDILGLPPLIHKKALYFSEKVIYLFKFEEGTYYEQKVINRNQPLSTKFEKL